MRQRGLEEAATAGVSDAAGQPWIIHPGGGEPAPAIVDGSVGGSHDGVAGCCLAEPVGAELGGALPGVEVDVGQAEAVAESVGPFEVVLGAPVEVAVDGDPV